MKRPNPPPRHLGGYGCPSQGASVSSHDEKMRPIVRVRLAQMALRRPRQWGACWLGCQLWEQLGLGEFWRDKLTTGREGTRWDQVLQTLVLYRLIDPGSEWRLHRPWFEHTAIADLLGGDFALAQIHRLYACHDQLVAHKAALFAQLTARWRDLFGAQFEVLLSDLTSTYFEPGFRSGMATKNAKNTGPAAKKEWNGKNPIPRASFKTSRQPPT